MMGRMVLKRYRAIFLMKGLHMLGIVNQVGESGWRWDLDGG